MTLTFAQIRDAAVALRKRERQKLRDLLDETLDPSEDEELLAELDRRHQEALANPGIMIPQDCAIAELRERCTGTQSLRSLRDRKHDLESSEPVVSLRSTTG